MDWEDSRSSDIDSSADVDSASDDHESLGERNRSSDHSADGLSSSHADDGGTPNDTLTTDHDYDSGSYDGSSVSDSDKSHSSAQWSAGTA